MICVYDSKTTDFTKNGLVVLSELISFYTTERLNDLFEVDFEYPLDDRGKWQYIVEDNIVKNSDGQLFRIYWTQLNIKSIKAKGRHIFYDLLDNFIENATSTNLDGASTLNKILTSTQYTHSFVNMSDITKTDSLTISKTNPVDAILGKTGMVSVFGGELVRDNFNIKLLQARGQDRGILVSYGKNIQGIEQTIDLNPLITRIYPTGKNGLTITEKYIDSQYINNYPHPIVKEVKFDTITTEAELRTAAQNYFTSSKCDIPLVNYKIDFLELTKTEEYKNYSVLEAVYLGDTVTIKHQKLGINLKAKVISIKKNDISGKIDKIELGNFAPNLSSGISNSFAQVKSNIVETKSSLQLAMDNATTQINSALGGYVLKRNNELLCMDTQDPMTATKVWRWNLGGLGYSGTGYNGTFRTAITADGHIVADFMDTGTLNASLITVTGLVVGNNVTMGPSATIGWGQVTGTPNLTKIDANGIYTGTVSASQINGGTISASISITSPSISGGTISGVTISGTTINGGTITGATVQTASSGARVVINTSNLSAYNSSGYLTSQLSGSGMYFYDQLNGSNVGNIGGGNGRLQFHANNAVDFNIGSGWPLTITSSNVLVEPGYYFYTPNIIPASGNNIYLGNYGNYIELTSDGSVRIHKDSTNYIQIASGVIYGVTNGAFKQLAP